jgi:hypothetical protein
MSHLFDSSGKSNAIRFESSKESSCEFPHIDSIKQSSGAICNTLGRTVLALDDCCLKENENLRLFIVADSSSIALNLCFESHNFNISSGKTVSIFESFEIESNI